MTMDETTAYINVRNLELALEDAYAETRPPTDEELYGAISRIKEYLLATHGISAFTTRTMHSDLPLVVEVEYSDHPVNRTFNELKCLGLEIPCEVIFP
jgi:chromosome condensin MukBEF complex kleisin-like MukF subunit